MYAWPVPLIQVASGRRHNRDSKAEFGPISLVFAKKRCKDWKTAQLGHLRNS